jgi:hypothetical protein
MLKRIADKLNLTAGRHERIKTLLTGERVVPKTLLGQINDTRKNLREALPTADANESLVRPAFTKVVSAEVDLAIGPVEIET